MKRREKSDYQNARAYLIQTIRSGKNTERAIIFYKHTLRKYCTEIKVKENTRVIPARLKKCGGIPRYT